MGNAQPFPQRIMLSLIRYFSKNIVLHFSALALQSCQFDSNKYKKGLPVRAYYSDLFAFSWRTWTPFFLAETLLKFPNKSLSSSGGWEGQSCIFTELRFI